ncbi:MAG: hypothetical protein AAB071_06700 [Bacteroidota bacterium]
MKKRGTNEEEILEVLATENELDAKNGRKKKFKIFQFQNIWNEKYYEHKKVEVVYALEQNIIVTVTVYVYYGIWL